MKGTQTLTGKDGSALALLLHTPVLLATLGERRLEDKAPDVVVPFKVGASFLQLLVLQIRGHVCHLDVGKLGLQVFRVHLSTKNNGFA